MTTMTTTKKITFAGVDYTTPFADSMPPLAPNERAELCADIAAHGVTCPVIVTDSNEVIDGHNRLEIAVELNLKAVPMTVLKGLTPEQKRARAEDLNLHRRHLTRDQKQEIIARRLKSEPERSSRDIATDLKVDHKTVGKIRAGMESTGEIPQLSKTKGRDGRTRKVTRRSTSRTNSPVQTSPPAVASCNGDEVLSSSASPASRYSWWSRLDSYVFTITAVVRDLKRLRKTPVSERALEPVLLIVERMRQIADDLEQRTTEGGKK